MADELHVVTLGLGAEIFAVPVGCVIEILAMRELFRVPDAPVFLAGLTEVREQVVPVIDLRRKLGLEAVPVTHHTRIIVLEISSARGRHTVGLIADRVIEVIALSAAQIGKPPEIGQGWDSRYIAGVAKHAGSFVIVFDTARLFSADDVSAIEAGHAHNMQNSRAA